MTPVNVMNGEQLLVQIETAPGSGVYEADCLINTDRGIKFTSSITKDVIPFCDDPASPAWVQATKDGLEAQVTGAGMTHIDSVPFWFGYFKDPDSRNCRVKVNAPGGMYWQGKLTCSDFEPATGTRKKKTTASVTLQSDGEMVLYNNDGTLYVWA
jgi:hypothetical protein